jgi:aryl-alcohol dehydrogenase-like predicted oxidoreductase
MKSLKEFKESLKVKKIGFSFNDPKEYYAVIEKNFHPDLVQVPFNFLDNRFASIIDNLKINGCEIHARSVFLQGLFFSDTKILPSFFEEIKETIWNLQVVHAQALPAGLLRYVLDNKQIDKVVIGVQNQEQLKLILESMDNAPVLAKHDIVIKENILQPSYWPKREW